MLLRIPEGFKGSLLFVAAGAMVLAGTAARADWVLSEAGLRGGFDMNDGNADAGVIDLYAVLDPEWNLGEIFNGWAVSLDLLGQAGVLFIEDETAFSLHAGLALFFEPDGSPFSLRFSSGPTLLSDDEFDDFDMGSQLQFTSAATVLYQFGSDWVANVSVEHISNAGIDEENPGLNLILFGLGRRF